MSSGLRRATCLSMPSWVCSSPLSASPSALRHRRRLLGGRALEDRLDLRGEGSLRLELEVAAIHDDMGYRRVREALSKQYDLNWREPNIQVWNVNLRGDRSLTLRHTQHNDRPLHEGAQEVLKHVARLWGFGVQMESVNAAGDVTKRWTVPAPPG